MEQHSIEPIDSAQKENLAQLIRKLDDRGKEEIGEIELALTKMSSDRYGICELCSKSIPIKRLKVVPATRLCRNCAQKYEDAQIRRNHHRDEIIHDALLDQYRNLNNENLSLLVAEKVVRQAPCPVLTIRPKGEPLVEKMSH